MSYGGTGRCLSGNIRVCNNPRSFLTAYQGSVVSEGAISSALPIVAIAHSKVQSGFLSGNFSYVSDLFTAAGGLNRITGLHIAFDVHHPSNGRVGRAINFTPFNLGQLGVDFASCLFNSFADGSSLVLCGPRFRQGSYTAMEAAVITTATAVGNGSIRLLGTKTVRRG